MPLSVLTALINLYCIAAILTVKGLRKTEFLLVATQTIIDFLISGVGAFIYYAPRVWEFYLNMCFYSQESRDTLRKHLLTKSKHPKPCALQVLSAYIFI